MSSALNSISRLLWLSKMSRCCAFSRRLSSSEPFSARYIRHIATKWHRLRWHKADTRRSGLILCRLSLNPPFAFCRYAYRKKLVRHWGSAPVCYYISAILQSTFMVEQSLTTYSHDRVYRSFRRRYNACPRKPKFLHIQWLFSGWKLTFWSVGLQRHVTCICV